MKLIHHQNNCRHCIIKNIEKELKIIEDNIEHNNLRNQEREFILELIKILDQIINSLFISKIEIGTKIQILQRYHELGERYRIFYNTL